MGKGRAPCCDKSQVKRGPWSPDEDLKLIAFVQKYGHENWRALPKQAGLQRCGKSCRLRWINYLRPDLKRGNFTAEEEETIIRLHKAIGNKWSKIASCMPGRTDNEIKNVWNTHLKKKLVVKNSESSASESKLESSITSSSSSESFLSSNEVPKSTTPTTSEFNEQTSQVTMTNEIKKDYEKQLSSNIELVKDPKDSSNISLSSIESNILNTSQIGDMASPLSYLGSYDVDNILQEVEKPNNLIEIPWESDYDLWNFIENIGTYQSNDQVQLEGFQASDENIINFGEENVQDVVEAKKWSHEFENEFGVGEKLESNKGDGVLPKNYDAVEPEIDPHAFDFNDITMQESELDFGNIQLWPSLPQNNNLGG